MGSSVRHPADHHDLMRVKGARENNLKNATVEIPKRRITVFTGVSGSGKSSLVIGNRCRVPAVDLGRGAVHDGGKVVFQGTPGLLIASRSTLTGEHRAAFVGKR